MFDSNHILFERRTDKVAGVPVVVYRATLKLSAEYEVASEAMLSTPEINEANIQQHLVREINRGLYGDWLDPIEGAIWQIETLNPISQPNRTREVLKQLRSIAQQLRNHT